MQIKFPQLKMTRKKTNKEIKMSQMQFQIEMVNNKKKKTIFQTHLQQIII